MLPILILSLLGILVLFFGSARFCISLSVLGVVAAIGGTFYELANAAWMNEQVYGTAFVNGMIEMNLPRALLTASMLTSSLFVFPFVRTYAEKENAQHREYCSLMLFALAGGVMMVTFANLLMLFVGLEVLSISVYCLAGSDKKNVRSNESAMKYFLQGAFFTGILLFGIALMYGATGSFETRALQASVMPGLEQGPLIRNLGMVLILVGLLFKASAAPFHFWTADVYEGAPTPFTSFMATVVKTAAFGAILVLAVTSFGSEIDHDFWFSLIAVCVVLTLIIGNLFALNQTSFKRLMAYSSIAHAGYMLIGILALSQTTTAAILFYTLAYGVATASAFGVLIIVSEARAGENIEIFRGLAKHNPFLAFTMTVALSSLAGIPLTAGFLGKFWIFVAAFEYGLVWAVLLAVIASGISAYYYFKVIGTMYMTERGADTVFNITLGQKVVLGIASFVTILLGIAPDLLKWVRAL